jgi:seryl-tRNA synthetase
LEDLGRSLNETAEKLRMYKKRAEERTGPLYARIKELEGNIADLKKVCHNLEEKLRNYI